MNLRIERGWEPEWTILCFRIGLTRYRKPPNEDPWDDRRWEFSFLLGPAFIFIEWGRFPHDEDD